MQRTAGLYLGTEVGGRSWRRYTDKGFSACSSGLLWTDERGVFFLRHLTVLPLFVGWSSIEAVESGVFHTGRWALGPTFLMVRWTDDGKRLRSGFLVAGTRGAELQALDAIRREHIAHALASGEHEVGFPRRGIPGGASL